jgi:hypothetical protein
MIGSMAGFVSDAQTKVVYSAAAEFKPRRLFSYASKTITADRKHYLWVKKEVQSLIQHINRGYQKKLIDKFSVIFDKDGFAKAYKWLKATLEPVQTILAKCSFDDLELLKNENKRKLLADKLATYCVQQFEIISRQLNAKSDDYESKIITAYQFLIEITKFYGTTPPYNPDTVNEPQAESGILRLFDADYWFKKFDKIAARTNEHIAIALGLVNKQLSPYVSKNALSDFKLKRKNNLLYLNMMDAVNKETGEKINLLELVKASSADPEKRRIELMVRCRGLEELAKKQGKDAVFITITAPSQYHKNGKNSNWNGSTPKDTQAYLTKLWAQTRAELARQAIDYNGVRVVEPHADSTPHWHILLFVTPEQRIQLTSIIRKYVTKKDKDELIQTYKKHLHLVRIGVAKHYRSNWYSPRFTCELIDPERGSATGYIAKYISKNINGAKMDGQIDDEAEIALNESADRVSTWASLWGIRQFQFFGAASVTVWRECRRLKEPLEDDALELVRQAADKGDWQEFSEYMQVAPITLLYDENTDVNEYNEPVKKIKGIKLKDNANLAVITRIAEYALERRAAASWSPVTNYTEVINSDSKGINTIKKLGFDDEEITFLLNGQKITSGDGFIYQIRSNELREFKNY